jgi:hypothetical protein
VARHHRSPRRRPPGARPGRGPTTRRRAATGTGAAGAVGTTARPWPSTSSGRWAAPARPGDDAAFRPAVPPRRRGRLRD